MLKNVRVLARAVPAARVARVAPVDHAALVLVARAVPVGPAAHVARVVPAARVDHVDRAALVDPAARARARAHVRHRRSANVTCAQPAERQGV